MRYQDVLSSQDIDYILNLPEVINAKEKIDAKNSGSIYFNITLTQSIKEILKEKMGLDLFNVESIPMRYIKGDTIPHVDHGSSSFDNTYLLYLTDSEGSLILDTESYPIEKNSGFVFNENTYHETKDTGAEPRLLLGPMSEDGMAVGLFVINANGNTTIYIRHTGADVEYSFDKDSWNQVFWPCGLQNDDTSLGFLRVELTTDITLTTDNSYFYPLTDKIQIGSTKLKDDGTRPIITIDGVADYPGLIRNGDGGSNGFFYIYAFNLEITTANASTLATEGGWIGQSFFSKGINNNYIINCHSNGPISQDGGGIVGAYSGSEPGANLTIIGCSSSGTLGNGAGGIAGKGASLNGGVFYIRSCFTSNIISGTGAGGIVGINSGDNGSNLYIEECYSTGLISGTDAGGIVGSNAGINGGYTNINNCYKTGAINGSNSGGIVGANSIASGIYNCYTTGIISGSSNAGGICGNTPTVANISNCYTTGTTDNATGYITGGTADIPPNCYSENFNASSGWNKTNANTVLQDLPDPVVGAIWTETTLNQPYELTKMGYTPYTTENIDLSPNPIMKREYPLLGDDPNKDMDNENYTEEFDPNNYQNDFFPGMADFIDGNIVAGDKAEDDRLIASYWSDLGNDVFDDWGYFYLYDVNSGKYYFPLINPQNEADGTITTQTFTAFDRTFTIKHGWVAQGIFKFEITVDDALPFRFGAYGNMGSDGSEFYEDLTYVYQIDGSDKILYYHHHEEDGDSKEQLYSYFVPKLDAENNEQTYNAYYDSDDMSIVSKEVTTGLTVFFAKSYDVNETIANELKKANGETIVEFVMNQGSSTGNAIVSDKNYTILQINGSEGPIEENTITIDSSTGDISTTSETEPGLYTIYVRNNGSYNISKFYLLVLEVDVDYPAVVYSAVRSLNGSLDRRSGYNAINSVVILNAGLGTRLNTNQNLVRGFNFKFA